MKTKKLIFCLVTVYVNVLIALIGQSCQDLTKRESEIIDSTGESENTEETTIRYQAFNLELAAEEAYYIHHTHSRTRHQKEKTAKEPSTVAIEELRDTCSFRCATHDLKCLQEYFECEESTATVSRLTSGDDRDGPEPLPPASDTIMIASVRGAEVAVFSDEPASTGFKLLTIDDKLYAKGDASSDLFSYDKEKRMALFKIAVENPELIDEPLYFHMYTLIVNAEGKKRPIELKRPFELVLKSD